jgi:hypothetical protein
MQGENMEKDIETLVRSVHKPRITAKAFEKMNIYARLVSSIVEKPVEVMGLLVGEDRDQSCTATDVYLMRDQHVKGWEGVPEGNGIGRGYIWAKQQGKKIVGMWHSHGRYPNFHSDDDDEHLMAILIRNSYYLQNNLRIEEKDLPYAMSIVINETSYQRPCPAHKPKKEDHYFCCVGIREEEKSIVSDLELEIVDSDVGVVLDEYALVQEVCNNVKYNGKYLRDFIEIGSDSVMEMPVFGVVISDFIKDWFADSWYSIKNCFSSSRHELRENEQT